MCCYNKIQKLKVTLAKGLKIHLEPLKVYAYGAAPNINIVKEMVDALWDISQYA